MVRNLKTAILATFTLISSIVIMYNMNVKLTLALLPVIPYMLIVTAVVGHYTQKTQLGVQARFAGITAFFAERLQRMRLVKSFGKEEEEIEQGEEVLLKHYTAEKKRAIVDLFAEPLMQSTQAIVVGTVLIYGGILVQNGELRVSSLIGFYMYVNFIHNNVLKYGILWQSLKQARGATENIAHIVEGEDEELKRQQSMANDVHNDLSLQNVSFGYSERTILNNLNVTIPAGKVTALVGPSGCGKSTILNLLERFYEPRVGRIMIGNTPAENIHIDEWREAIAYVSQASPLLSGTIRDNITYGLPFEASEEDIRQAAVQANALDFIEQFPDGFETEVGEFGTKLSGGQRQRIAIARAFIKNAPILLLDEATASLDARSEHAVVKALKQLMKDRTTVIVAHDMDLIKDADQIIVIDRGAVSAAGTHKELYKHNELYKQLVEIQDEKESRLSVQF
ncbi:ABC transporter ATP-binding protein [Sporosarcina saromensis]|uniref:ABC transporter ATP-binding protein n=1 Tax=Sporosarcina saromensis TaxID=359365 RepID=A0ABU4GDS6_9BACL|nr:ABC transporter ATP-binding protein [Sporosarcina saromensis]MDW0114460.1 ABC transporter ATP-binding protein [Sporosarcina saromensis]